MSKKLVANFTTDELKKLVDDNTSCVTVHKSVYNLQLYPYHLSDVGASIKKILNAKVAKYDKILNGILLGYKNIKLITPKGSIISDSCFIHITIEGDFYIFKPEIGSLLTGIVNKKSDDHVGCLVHRLFNVSVPNTDEGNWAGQDINIGDEVILRVGLLDVEARLPYIRSEFVETKTKTKKKKVIKIEAKEDFTDSQTKDKTATKKKKKREKLTSDSVENALLNGSIKTELDTSLKMKKKIKQEKIDADLNLDESLDKIKKKIEELKNAKNDKLENIDTSLIKKKKIKQEKIDAEPFANNNGSYVDSNLDESLDKIKKKIQDLKNSKNDKLKNIELESKNSQSEPKKKRKSTEIKKQLNSSKSKKEKIKMNGLTDIKTEEIKSLENSEIIQQIVNFDKSPKEKKKRKSKEQNLENEPVKISIHATPTIMADAEDRITKKRKSLTQNIDWENKKLDLYDAELEKTLGESSPSKAEESSEFNLVKIAALNENNLLKRDSSDDFVDKKEKKRKRKSSDKDTNDGEQKPKKRKQETNVVKSEVVAKKSTKT